MPQNPDVMPVWKSFHLRQKASPADPILVSVGRKKGLNVTHNVTKAIGLAELLAQLWKEK
jgi:hypothetical protein